MHGALLSLCARKEKVSKEKARPTSGPAFRFATCRVRSLHRRSTGTARRDILVPSRLSRHPCRSTPSTPIPLTLLTGLSVSAYRQLLRSSVEQDGFGSRTSPVRRPSAGVAQQVSRQDAEKAPMDHGWSFGACLRSNAGARGVSRSETRMSGGLLLLTFLGQARKVRRLAGRNRSYQSTATIIPANNIKTAPDCQSPPETNPPEY